MHLTYARHTGHVTAGLLLTAVLFSGCSMVSGPQPVHQSAKGAVYLEEVSEWSFEADHPTMIDQTTMLKIVKGVMAEESVSTSNRLPASGSKPMRVFSDEDAEFLAPLLAQGLSRAKPEEMIGFRVSSSAGSGTTPTAGTLYVQHGAVYFTISSPKGMKAAGFTPRSAAHIESAPSFAAKGAASAMSIVIDYPALARASMPQPVPVAALEKSSATAPAAMAASAKTSARVFPVNNQTSSPEASSGDMTTEEMLNKKLEELRQVKEANASKESEIRMLRKETEWMKKELRERTAERDAMKAKAVSSKPAPKKKTADLQSTR